MDAIMGWMKEFLILYLMLTVAMHLAATDEYKKYLRFLSGILLLLVLISPLLRLLGADGKLAVLDAYGEFWKKLDTFPSDFQGAGFGETDFGKTDFEETDFQGADGKGLDAIQDGYYRERYEHAAAMDMMSQAKGQGIPLGRVSVCMASDYSISRVSVWLDMLQKEETAPVKEQLLSFLQDTYGLVKEQVFIY